MTLTTIKRAGLDGEALDRVFTIGASGNSAYTFQGEGLNGTVNNPTLYLTRGKTYRFENGSGGHPFRIQSTTGTSGTAYNTGVTNNNTVGTVIVEVQHDAPDVLYYQCTSHAAMNGILYITGALADGGVTTAKLADNAVTASKITAANITTAKIADSAVAASKIADANVTTAKIANDAVTTAKIADDAVTAPKIANGVVGTSELADGAVNEAKFIDIASGRIMGRLASGTGDMTQLTAASVRSIINVEDGATASSGTTINNNADNRVITGSGTANTLNGESQFTYDGKALISAGSAELEVKGTAQGRVVVTDSAANSGKKSFDVISNGDYMKVRTLSDDLSTATDAIQVQGSTGIVTLSSNPYWIGYMSSTFSSGTGSWVTLPVNTTRYQVGSNFNTSNHYFTVPISGLYQITMNCEMDNVNNQSWIYLMPRIGNDDTTTTASGIAYCDFSPTSHAGSGNSTYFHYSRTEVVRLIKDQVVRFQTYASGNQYRIGANNQNSFSIVWIGQS